MKTFEQLRRYIKENIPDPFKTKNGESPDFGKNLEKAKSKGLKTYKQKGLDLYKAGGPYIPDKEVTQKTGKKVTQQIKKPYFGKPTLPQKTQKSPDRKGLKKAISDIRSSERRLYDAGVGKKPSLVQQRKFTLSKIKRLSRQTTLTDRLYGSSGSTEGTAGASGSAKKPRGGDGGSPYQPYKPKTVTPTKPQKSASATDYTKKINQANKNRKEFTGNKKSFQAFKKQADAASDKLVAKREVVRSTTGTKDVKQLRDINKQIKSTERISKGYDLASKGKGNLKSPVVKASDLKQVTANTAKVTFNPSKPQKGKELVPNAMSGNKSKGKGNIVSKINKGNVSKKIVKKYGLGTKKYASVSSANKAFGQSPIGKIVKKVGLKPSYATRKITKTLGKKALKAAPVLAIPAGILASPYLRTGVKGALLGGGLAAFKNPKKGELAKLSSKKIVGSPVKLGQKIPTTLPKPK